MQHLRNHATTAANTVSKAEARKITKERVNRIKDLHDVFVASRQHSMLIVFQGMDGSGKDGAAKNVFGLCAPYGLRSYSFKRPTEEERSHDFLWRIYKQLPAKGEIALFNRSHYEDVVIQRVHNWIDKKRVQQRINAINAFEENLRDDNNTTILKFFLHISYEQQQIELQQRIDDPTKQWKHNANDWKERELWDEYMNAYDHAIRSSSIPWHIIPVDQRWYRDYLISGIVLEAMENMQLDYPRLQAEETDK